RCWERLHIDLTGPVSGKYWLICVDAFTKWVEVAILTHINSASVINNLRNYFARFGLPRYIVSDNGTQFTGSEFKTFLFKNNIKHFRSAPYSPKSNGLAERYIRTIKTRFYAGRRCGTPDQLNLANVLITHRNTPNATTGKSPAEMMFGRSLRTTLDQWKLSTRERTENALWKQKYYKDRSVEPREFVEQQKVWIANERTAGWHEGKVLQRKSAILYDVESEGIVKNKHADQLRDAHTQEKEIPVTLTEEVEKAEHENTTLEKRVSKPPLRYHDEFNL
ncbi:unnamed protein product, partial [Gordionus sp. m RMFG-2023]